MSIPDLPHALLLSARDDGSLRELARTFVAFLGDAGSPADLESICHSAALRRGHSSHRLAVLGYDRGELRSGLDAFAAGDPHPHAVAGTVASRRARKVAFVFPGQGSEWSGMGRDLLEHDPVFRDSLTRTHDVLRQYVEWTPLDELTASEGRSRMDRLDVSQPTLFAMAVALSDVWRAWGLEPDVVIGHSVGEPAAAYAAGVLTLDEAARVVCSRSRALNRAVGKGGGMLVVDLSDEESRQVLRGREDLVSVAVSNSVRSSVLAGDSSALRDIESELQRRDVFCRLLPYDVASHSPHMDPLLDDLVREIGRLDPQPGEATFCSTVTAGPCDGRDLGVAYWARNLRETVRFSAAIRTVIEDDITVFVEMSAHPLLAGPILDACRALDREGTVLPSMHRNEDGRIGLLRSVAALHTIGHPVDWSRRYPRGPRHVVLPNTPWRRERLWVEQRGRAGHADRRRRAGAAGADSRHHPLLERHVRLAGAPHRHVWEVDLDTVSFPYLAHHRVHGAVVVVGMTFVEMAIAAGARVFGAVPDLLTDIAFERALVLPEGATRTAQIIVSQAADDRFRFEIHSRPEPSPDEFPSWLLHASGTIHDPRIASSGPQGQRPELGTVRDRCTEMLPGADCYKLLFDIGAEFLPLLQGIQRAWLGEGHLETLAEIEEPDALVEEISGHHVHPAVLDACGQALLVPFAIAASSAEVGTCVPRTIDRLWIGTRPGSKFWSHARRDGEMKADSFTGDVRLLDDTGEVLVEVQGFHLQAPEHYEADLGESLYQVEWQPAPHLEAGRAPAGGSSGRWMILADRSGAAETLRSLLEARGEAVVMVSKGDRYERLEPGRYLVDPGSPLAFERLLGDAFPSGGPACAGVVHLFSLDGSEVTDIGSLEEAHEAGPIAALHLVQALGTAVGAGAPRIWLFTAGVLSRATGSTPIAIADAPLWGLGRTIAHEHPELRCTTVDIPRVRDAAVLEAAFEELWASDGEDQIALLPDGRRAARLVRRSLQELGASGSGSGVLREDATYLVTGGFGGLGLAVADWMAERGARNLVLAGRRGATSAEARAAVLGLRGRGAHVVESTADVTREDELAELLATVRAEMPALRGIIHAAGVLDDGILDQLDRARFEAVLAPKTRGAFLLHALTADLELDFFVLFSSVASLLGLPGQGNYAAANSFLDALALHRRAQGLPCLSINWGPWSEIGGAALGDSRGVRLAFKGMASISPAHGLEMLGTLLGCDAGQVAVMPLDLRQWRRFSPEVARSPLFSGLYPSVSAPAVHEPRARFGDSLLRSPAGDRAPLIESYVRTEVAQILRMPVENVEPDALLLAQGFDSLMAIELRNRIEHDLGVVLPVAKLLWGSTVQTLAAELLEQVMPASPAAPENPPATVSAETDWEEFRL